MKRPHRNKQGPDTGGKRYEALKSSSDRQPSGLEERPSGIVFQDDGSPTPRTEGPTAIEEDDQGASEKVSSFLIEFGGVLLRVAKQGLQRTVSQLENLLANTSFSMNIFSGTSEVLRAEIITPVGTQCCS